MLVLGAEGHLYQIQFQLCFYPNMEIKLLQNGRKWVALLFQKLWIMI